MNAPTVDLARLARACRLDAEPLGDGRWRVCGGTASYHIVIPARFECDCRWHELHPRESCKHLERVRLALGDRDAIAALAALVPVPERARRRKVVGRGVNP